MTDENKCPKCGATLSIHDVGNNEPFRYACPKYDCGYVDRTRVAEVEFSRHPGIDIEWLKKRGVQNETKI